MAYGLVTESTFIDAVACAITAPSPHNSQPWRFRYDPASGCVQIRLDRARAASAVDPSGWGARMAIGAAACNLGLAFAVAGQPMCVTWLPANSDPELQALLSPRPAAPPTEEQVRLHRAIPLRRSSRGALRPAPLPPSGRTALLRAAQEEQAWLELLTGPGAVGAVAGITRAAHEVLERERGAGVGPRAPWPETGDETPLVAVLGTARDLAIDHLRAGYALQRVLLTVADLGLSSSMYSQPIEVPRAREQLRLALGRSGAPQMVLRIGYGEPMPRSPRRDARDVIDA